MRFKENVAKQQAANQAKEPPEEATANDGEKSSPNKEEEAAAVTPAGPEPESQLHLYVKGIQLGFTEEQTEEHIAVISLSDASVGMKTTGQRVTVTGHLGNLQVEDGRAEGSARELVGSAAHAF